MDQDAVTTLVTQAMQLAMKVGLPLLVLGLVVGLIVSVFQAVTQIQEQSLQFVPKVLALVALLLLAGPWMLNEILAYTQDLWSSIPDYARRQ